MEVLTFVKDKTGKSFKLRTRGPVKFFLVVAKSRLSHLSLVSQNVSTNKKEKNNTFLHFSVLRQGSERHGKPGKPGKSAYFEKTQGKPGKLRGKIENWNDSGKTQGIF